jgi:hypothetical protein
MCAGFYYNVAGECRVCSCALDEMTDRVGSRFIDLDPGVRPFHLRTRED